jgi:putative copper resistance protein D
MAPGVHTDGELFYWISYGFPNSAMPAWKDTLTEEQRWDVLNYARTLSDQNSQPRAAAPPSQP